MSNPNPTTSEETHAAGGNVNPVENKFTDRLSHVLSDLGKNGIFIALIAVVVLFSILTNGILLRPQNISNLVVQNGYILVLAIGMVMVIIAGHIDLSVGSVAAFVGACSGVFAVQWGLPWWLSVILSLGIGALVGVWQGFWIAFVGIPAFIVTLAGMLIFRGLALVVLGNANIGSFPAEYRALGNGFLTDVFGEFELDPLTLGVGALAIIALIVQQVRTRRGRQKYGQDVEPMAWFITKLVLVSAAIGFFAYSLAVVQGHPDHADHPRRARAGLRHRDEPHGVRPPHLRDRRQPPRGGAVGHQDPPGRLLAVREHGHARRPRRPHLHRATEPRGAEGR